MPVYRRYPYRPALRRTIYGRGTYYPRRRKFVRGRGDYFSDAVRGIGSSVSKIFGDVPRKVVNRVGSFLSGKGTYRRARIGRRYLKGKGNYIAPPVQRGAQIDMGQPVASFSKGSDKRYVEVVHEEYIQDINSSVAFTNTVFPINPGLPSTFPWLSTLCGGFEEYKFEQLVFQFRSTAANALNSTNTALGTVIGACNYNVTQSAFTTKQQMENYEYAVSGPPSCTNIYPVECNPKDNTLQHLYIRTGSLGANQDLRFNDLGNFQIATQGSQAAANIGELWVSYRVRLYKPSLSTVGTSDVTSCHYGQTAFTSTIAATITAAAPFGTPNVPASTSFEIGSNLALTFSGNTITLPASLGAGSFMIYHRINGGSVAQNFTGWACTTNCTDLKICSNHTVAGSASTSGATATQLECMRFFTITGPSAVLTFTATTIPSAPTSSDIFIVPINPNILTKKQLMLRNAVIRRSDDPNYDPYEGKYQSEELEENESHMLEFDHKRSKFITNPNKTIDLTSQQQDDQDDELNDDEYLLIQKYRRQKALSAVDLIDNNGPQQKYEAKANTQQQTVKLTSR